MGVDEKRAERIKPWARAVLMGGVPSAVFLFQTFMTQAGALREHDQINKNIESVRVKQKQDADKQDVKFEKIMKSLRRIELILAKDGKLTSNDR